MLVTILLLALLAVAAATDLAWHKIYNWTTYGGAAAALAVHGIAAIVEQDWTPLTQSLWGLLACGVVMLICFVFFAGVGGGDVKLIAMMGAFLGVEQGLTAMLWTFVLGACAAVIVLIWRVGPGRLLASVWRQAMSSLRIGMWTPLTDQQRAQLQAPLFLAPCSLLAVAIVRFSLEQYVPLF